MALKIPIPKDGASLKKKVPATRISASRSGLPIGSGLPPYNESSFFRQPIDPKVRNFSSS